MENNIQTIKTLIMNKQIEETIKTINSGCISCEDFNSLKDALERHTIATNRRVLKELWHKKEQANKKQ